MWIFFFKFSLADPRAFFINFLNGRTSVNNSYRYISSAYAKPIMMHFSKIYTRTPIINYHTDTTHIHTTRTRSSTYRWAHRYKTVDRYDPSLNRVSRRYVFDSLLSWVRVRACAHVCVCVCACEWILLLPAAVAALIAPTQWCPLFGGCCFAWMLCLHLLLCWILLTLFENWNNGWSWPILFLLGANTLGSAIEMEEILL